MSNQKEIPVIKINLESELVIELRKELESSDISVDDCFNQALSLLLWAVREKRKNHIIVALATAEGLYYELKLDVLNKISPHTIIDENGDKHSIN